MVDLDSPAWSQVAASAGDGTHAAFLLKRIRAGGRSDEDYGELFNQICHQYTAEAAAYLAVPHLAEIASALPRNQRTWPLGIIGGVEAARASHPTHSPPLPAEHKAEYHRALEAARRLTADTLSEPVADPSDFQGLLATLAALNGSSDVAMHLFLSDPDDFSCPSCGEKLTYRDPA